MSFGTRGPSPWQQASTFVSREPQDRRTVEQTVQIHLRLSDEDVRRVAECVVALLRQSGPAAEGGSPYLTIQEAAAYLRCRRQRIDDLLSQRRLSRVKDGSRTLILRAELEGYLARAPAELRPAGAWESAA